MPEYLAPGVYVEETEPGPRPIEGVPTSTAGFLGPTQRGPLEPRLVTGFGEFERLYGGYPDEESYLPFAVRGFFENGGQRAFVARIAPADASASTALHDGKIRVEALGPGGWGDRIALKIEEAGAQPPGERQARFNLTAMYWDALPPSPISDPTDEADACSVDPLKPTILEVYDNLSAAESSDDFYEKRINGDSSLIRVKQTVTGAPALLPLSLLADLGRRAVAGSNVGLADYQGRELPALADGTVAKTGLLGFEEVNEIAILCVPDHHRDPSLSTAIVDHCECTKNRFAILHSCPGSDTLADIGSVRPPWDTAYAAFYFPWIKAFDPVSRRDSLIPPSGHMAGIYARTDRERGVFKAPVYAVVKGADSLEFQTTEREAEILYSQRVNCIRRFAGPGVRVHGMRTCSTDPLWKFVSVRRFMLFLEESIKQGTQWVVFESNNRHLWARMERSIARFLHLQWLAGALKGAAAEEAFYVKADRTTMTQDDIDNGRLIVMIGMALFKPAEFVIFWVVQSTSDSAEV